MDIDLYSPHCWKFPQLCGHSILPLCYIYCPLEQHVLHLLWGVVEGFFDYNLIPETRTYLDGTLNISEGPRCALTKENGEIAPRGSA